MTAKDIRDIASLFLNRNLELPLGIEVSARSFRNLKKDASVITHFASNGTLKWNELKAYGIKIVGRLCECGAHPEDQE